MSCIDFEFNKFQSINLRSNLGIILLVKNSKSEDSELPELPQDVDSNYVSPRDIMLYLVENAPLKEWEVDILAILREEAYYFLPQRLTKIMNEKRYENDEFQQRQSVT